MTSSISGSTLQSNVQLQNLYSKIGKGGSSDTVFSGNANLNTNNKSGIETLVSDTLDQTSLSQEAQNVLKLLGSSENSAEQISKLLGGNGAGDLASELFGADTAIEPLNKALIAQSSALIEKANNSLVKDAKSKASLENDPIQKAIKAYQEYQNASNDIGSQLDEVA